MMKYDWCGTKWVTSLCGSIGQASMRIDGQEQGGECAKRRRQKRRPKLAPRFANAAMSAADAGGAASPEREPDASEPREEVELVRELFLTATSRCFVVKSFSDANLHKSLKYGVWSSTYAHNAVLDQAFNSDLAAVRPILLFFRCACLWLACIGFVTTIVSLTVCFVCGLVCATRGTSTASRA